MLADSDTFGISPQTLIDDGQAPPTDGSLSTASDNDSAQPATASCC